MYRLMPYVLVCSSLTPAQASARGCRPLSSLPSRLGLDPDTNYSRDSGRPHLKLIMKVRLFLAVKHSPSPSPSVSPTVWQLMTLCTARVRQTPSHYFYTGTHGSSSIECWASSYSSRIILYKWDGMTSYRW